MRTPETLTARQRAASLNLDTPPQSKKEASGMTTSDTTTPEKKLTPQQARLAAARDSLSRDSEASNAAYDPMDEIDGSIIVLDIHDIDEYSLNPRTKPNPDRGNLKVSMAADGITNLFSVTRRSPKEKYFPYGGGNTRVSLAKELLREGHEKFRTIQVITRKWPGESKVIAAHLSENDNRGDISFWERAQGVASYKKELEREGGKSLSATELNKALKETGLSYGIKMIQNFLFAIEHLGLIGNWLLTNDVNVSIRPTVAALFDIAAKFDKTVEVKDAIEEIFLMHATDLDSLEASNLETDPENRVEVRLDVESLLIQLQSVSSKQFGIDAENIEAVVQSHIQNPKLSADELRSISASAKSATQQGKQAPLGGMLGGVQNQGGTAPTKPQSKKTAAGSNGAGQHADLQSRITQNFVDLNAVVPISDFIKPNQGLPYGFLVDIPESMSVIGDQKLTAQQEDLRMCVWPILANYTGQCNGTLISQCDPNSTWSKSVNAGIEKLQQACAAQGILCAKNGQIYATSAHFGMLFSNPDANKCFSALIQSLAEYTLAAPEITSIPFKKLFAE